MVMMMAVMFKMAIRLVTSMHSVYFTIQIFILAIVVVVVIVILLLLSASPVVSIFFFL